jgi:hypothetical protein
MLQLNSLAKFTCTPKIILVRRIFAGATERLEMKPKKATKVSGQEKTGSHRQSPSQTKAGPQQASAVKSAPSSKPSGSHR